MVTLITEQLRKQSLEEPYHKAFSFNASASLPSVGSSPTSSWKTSKTQETSSPTQHPPKPHLFTDFFDVHSVWRQRDSGEPLPRPEVSFAHKAVESSPPPPPKRHCRSLSVPEDLSQCRSAWHPSASKVWTPIKHGCHSRGTSSFGPGSSFTSSSLHSSSSPNFFSLALSSDSCSFPWDPCDAPKGAGSASVATPSSSSSSPAPLLSYSVLQRRFSLSPVHTQNSSIAPLHPQPSPYSSITFGFSGHENPALSPSPSSTCSTPSSSRRDLHALLPRCHSQPCDMRKPWLKRRHDPDIQPNPRPGLDFSKMTQIGAYEGVACGADGRVHPVSSQSEPHLVSSPAEFLGRASIGPLSESEEEDEDRNRTIFDVSKSRVFERDCTELDLNLIEEN